MENFDPVEILIVEDNPDDIELMLRVLKKQNVLNNYFVAEDGKIALDFLFCRDRFSKRTQSKSLKVVFLDLKLPKFDGLEVLKEIKSNQETKNIPVVIFTSSNEDPDIKSAYELGANSYIVKPINFNDFILSIKTTGLYWLLVNKTTGS